MISFARCIQKFHGQKFLVDPICAKQLKKLGICATMDWVNYSNGHLVSDSPTTRCYRVSAKEGATYYFKRYICSSKRGLLFWMRPSKAAVEVWAYRKLASLEIPSIEVVAFGEHRVLGILKSAFLVTRAISNSQDLDHFALNDWYKMQDPLKLKVYREISNKLLEQTRAAHKGDFFHHDLKWRNILICNNDGHYSTVWIDAPRASKMLFRKHRGAVVDLSGLARLAISLLSVYDRMRFICKYLGSERNPGDAAHLYREVSSHLERRPPKPITLPERI